MTRLFGPAGISSTMLHSTAPGNLYNLSPISILSSQQPFFLWIGKTSISFLFLNWKTLLHSLCDEEEVFDLQRRSEGLQAISQSLYFLSWVSFSSLIICTTFLPLITFLLIVNLLSDLDCKLKQLYHLLLYLSFLYWISKSSLCCISFLSHKSVWHCPSQGPTSLFIFTWLSPSSFILAP